MLFTDKVFTASKEGFNIKTPKLSVIGHGINIEQFEKVGTYELRLPQGSLRGSGTAIAAGTGAATVSVNASPSVRFAVSA